MSQQDPAEIERNQQLQNSLLRKLATLYHGVKDNPGQYELSELNRAFNQILLAKFDELPLVFIVKGFAEAAKVRTAVDMELGPRLIREIADCYYQKDEAYAILLPRLKGTVILFDDGERVPVAWFHERQLEARIYRDQHGNGNDVQILKSCLRGSQGGLAGGGGRRIDPHDNLDLIERRVDRHSTSQARYGAWPHDDRGSRS